ncbi:MAG: serine/threonine-protein kinase [Nannocystaceae bacterium]|nr:serine/threonine-protein kinase [Nannocystaceae bacterium]
MDVDDVTALLIGDASPATTEAMHGHMAQCSACRAWVSELARASWIEARAPSEEDSPEVGGDRRYVPLVALGSGAMGTVWAAYDAKLDREVALKVLDSAAAAAQRLRKEAQALALLSHPNVVEILDVELDRSPPAIAMELVEGPTLHEWLSLASRCSREIVAVFTQAGCGLAAAHGAGVVHRDFKPSNALVGADGRVRVVDFGLAHGESFDTDEATRWAGTPAYMAPEQRQGSAATARSDQYAWCVALHEALLGHRPGCVTSAPGANDRVRRRVLAVILRGLQDEPSARWPSMLALLDALGRAASSTRWFVAGVLALGVLGAVAPRLEMSGRCEDRGAIGIRLWAWGLYPAAEHEVLSSQVQRWEAADREACWRGRSGDAQRAVAERHCLQRQATHLGLAVRGIASADALAVAGVVERLPSPPACLNTKAPEVLSADEIALDDAIVAATVLSDAGEQTAAIEQYEAIEERVERAGPPVRSRFALGYGSAVWAAGRDATPWLERAAREGTNGGDRRAAALAALQLAGSGSPAVPIDVGRATAWLSRAEALIDADEMTDLSGRLATARGNIALDAGRFEEALPALQEAVALARTQIDEPWVLANALGSLAMGQRYAGANAQAARTQREALELLSSVRGANHPSTVLARVELALIWSAAGRTEEAVGALGRSLSQLEEVLGPDHISVAVVATNLASAHLVAGDAEAAVQLLQRVTGIESQHIRPGRATASTLHALGNAYVLMDELEKAQQAFVEGLAHVERELGPIHPERAIFMTSLASVALDRGLVDEAIAYATKSRPIRAAAFGREDARLAFEDLVLAGAYLEVGKPALALDVAARGERLLTKDPVRPRWLAELHFFKARALADMGRVEEAHEAAHEAVSGFEAADDEGVANEIRAWASELPP